MWRIITNILFKIGGSDSSSGQKQMTQEEINEQMNAMFRQSEQDLNKQIMNIQFQQKQLKNEMNKYKDQPDILKIYAKTIVTSQKQVTRIHQQIASLKSIQSSLRQAMAQQRINNIVGQIGNYMQNTIQTATPEQKSAIRMFALQNEKLATSMGIMDEMLDDAFADDEISEAADKEVDQVVESIIGQQLTGLPSGKVQQQIQQDAEIEALGGRMAKLGNL